MTKPTLIHTKSEGEMEISKIIIPPRLREDNKQVRAYIADELAPSIAEQGLIQPITLNAKADGTFELIAGWSRIEAFKLLGLTHIPYSTRKDLSIAELNILELEENLRRNSMRWQDVALGIYKIHKENTNLKAKKLESWSARATGHLMGINTAKVSGSIKVAEYLIKGDKEILEASSLDAAQAILIGRKQKQAEAKLAKAVIDSPKSIRPSLRSSGPLGDTGLEPRLATLRPESSTTTIQKQEIEISLNHIIHDSCVIPGSDQGWMNKQPSETFDLIFTDIPYGINMENLDLVQLDQVKAEHDIDENVALMLPWLEQSYRLLKPNTYLIFFYDVKHHEKLQAWGEQVGFNVMPYPLIWAKTSSCKNRAAHAWPTKNIEYIMFMRKGEATLRAPILTSFFAASAEAERKLYGHPFAKPFDLCKMILDSTIFPGARVLDTYAGSGSMIRVALTMGCDVVAIEQQQDNYNRLVVNIQNAYKNMFGNKEVVFK